MRGVLSFAAIAGIFVGTIFFGGRALGAWDDLERPQPAGSASQEQGFEQIPPGWTVHSVAREGFSLALPIGWQAVRPGSFRRDLGPVIRANPRFSGFLRAVIGSRNSLIKLFLFDARRDSLEAAKQARFVANVNVAVVRGPRPSRARSAWSALFREQLGIQGRVERRPVALPASRASELRYRIRITPTSGQSLTVAVVQYELWHAGRQYFVTFETTPRQVDAYAHVFRESAETFRFFPRRHPKSKPPVDRAEERWLKDLNALCGRARRESGAFRRPRTHAEAEGLIAKLVTLNERYNDEFAALDPPARFEPEMRRLRMLFAKDERLLDRLLVAFRAGSPPAFLEVMGRLATVAERESAVFAELGATNCDFYGLSGAS
jgi:hypothetical protein